MRTFTLGMALLTQLLLGCGGEDQEELSIEESSKALAAVGRYRNVASQHCLQDNNGVVVATTCSTAPQQSLQLVGFSCATYFQGICLQWASPLKFKNTGRCLNRTATGVSAGSCGGSFWVFSRTLPSTFPLVEYYHRGECLSETAYSLVSTGCNGARSQQWTIVP